MQKNHKGKELVAVLETWYAEKKRSMPWRLNPTPYGCWLSEIMMQQTTYAAVLPYYERFLARFPSVESLAAADEADVLKQWEGLGYYARARNLHKAARSLVVDGKAAWPKSAAEWAKVPGVGPYTAAALASVLKGEPVPVVDGNVARVFARYWMISEDFKKLPARARLAERLTPEIEQAAVPGNFNQAMMELGALVCTPTSPDCGVCPLRSGCAARRKGVQTDYPIKVAKGSVPTRRATQVIIPDEKGRILLVQNREGGLLKGLWELPTVEPSMGLTQVFSHFKLELSTVKVLRRGAELKVRGSGPLATTTRKVLEAAGFEI